MCRVLLIGHDAAVNDVIQRLLEPDGVQVSISDAGATPASAVDRRRP